MAKVTFWDTIPKSASELSDIEQLVRIWLKFLICNLKKWVKEIQGGKYIFRENFEPKKHDG